MNPSKIIGITGGIATGKSIVAQYMSARYKLPIFDADIISRQAVTKGSPIWQRILDRYGENILTQDGNLNRRTLAQIIFHNQGQKQWLEQEIHPFVYNYLQNIIKNSTQPLIVFVIPLLFEAKMTDLVSEVWVVTCLLSQQIDRLRTRNNLSLTEAMIRIENQMPLEEKVKRADIVINNDQDLPFLYAQIDLILSRKFHKS